MNTLNSFALSLLNTFKRFPLVIFSAYLLSIILLIFTSVGHGPMEQYPNYNVANKIAFLMTLAMPLFYVLRLLSTRRIFIILGIVFLVAYYTFFLPLKIEGAPSDFFRQHFLFILALMIFSFVAPFVFKPISNEDFWEWTQQILFALITSAIFGFIIFLGLEGASYALEKLFNISSRGHQLKEQFSLLIFGVFGINYFLSQVPRNPHFIHARPYTKIENIFTKYILTPLVVGYFAILFVYTAKIIWLSEWPTGIMAWLILLFSALAILTLLFWTPLWNEQNKKYKKWIWIAILLQTFVLAISIYLRIEQYGVTENRYFITLFGLWLALTSLYFLLYKKASYKWIFLTLPLLIVLSQVGPFSSKNVSKKSQIAQLKELIGSSESLAKENDETLKYQISSKIDYLYQKHGIESLMPVIPEIVTTYQQRDEDAKNCESSPLLLSFPDYATDQLGFKHIDKWTWEDRKNRTNVERPIFIHLYSDGDLNVSNYAWLQSFSFRQMEENELYCPPNERHEAKHGTKSPYNIITKNNTITIEKEGKVLVTMKMEKFFLSVKTLWKEKMSNKSQEQFLQGLDQFSQEELTFKESNDAVDVKILFRAFEFSAKKKALQFYAGRILIHKK